MVARWMQAKKIKQAREKKAWAKPYSIKNSTGPNWHNGTQMTEGSLDLNIERQAENVRTMNRGRVPDISEVRKSIPDPFVCSTPCNTPYHRCRIYYNSQRTVFVIQYVKWGERKAKISFTYGSFQSAWQSFILGRTIWKRTINF